MAVVNHRHKTGEDLKWAVTMEFMKKVGRSPQIYTVPKKMTAHFVVGCPTGTNIFYIALRYQEVTLICNYVGGYVVVPSFLTNFRALYLTEFSTNFGQILDSNSYDQS